MNKFRNKYPIDEIKPYLSLVINKFVENDEISIPNLKLLDSHIKREAIIFPEYIKKRTMSLQICTDAFLPKIDQSKNERQWDSMSVKSKMSGVSQLSKFSDIKKPKFDIKPYEDHFFKTENKTPACKPSLSKFSYDSEDEWGSIIKFNNILYLEEQKKGMEKEKLLKERIKNDLDNQVKSKLNKKKEEKANNLNYDHITNQHAELLKELDQQNRYKYKLKCIEDKEMLDYQVKNMKLLKKKQKKLEDLNGKLFLKSIVEEETRAKSLEMERKMSACAFYQPTP